VPPRANNFKSPTSNYKLLSYLRRMMKVGILGGGQLGRMLLQAAANYPVETYVLESDSNCPAAHLCHHFVKGSITDFETVYQFGTVLDALTIEIEAGEAGKGREANLSASGRAANHTKQDCSKRIL
jgi:phosphoribosylaminoimidazole carboxylase (NCAIR synthetase)